MLRERIPPQMSLTEAARRIGVSRPTLYAVLNGSAAVSARMALRLAAATGTPAETWLSAQAQKDLARERRKPPRGVKPLA